jgi:hypothetical protein
MCRNVYIHHGSISHLSGSSVEYKRSIRDKRKQFCSKSISVLIIKYIYVFVQFQLVVSQFRHMSTCVP